MIRFPSEFLAIDKTREALSRLSLPHRKSRGILIFYSVQPNLALRERKRHARRLHRIMNSDRHLASDLGPVGELIRPKSKIEIDRAVSETHKQGPWRRVLQNSRMPAGRRFNHLHHLLRRRTVVDTHRQFIRRSWSLRVQLVTCSEMSCELGTMISAPIRVRTILARRPIRWTCP